MDFFEHQQRARRKTGLLVLYFILAVAMIIVAVNLAVLLVISATASLPTSYTDWWQQPYWVWTSFGVLLTIAAGTLFTMLKLRGGGRAVAEMVGARRIEVSTEDADERRLINVVEEMSIASGTPMPTLYVMEDAAINAFVAGYRPTEAVLVVTRGTLQHLNRDELQGVIGHEYSHILNGDMRINIRLMGILAGILIISQFGRLLMRSNSRGRGKGAGQAALLGFAFFIIGYIGIFFGSLIKAAVSRQRELLADAASVQFTRNPDGIAGALWKIKQHTEGSFLTNNRSDDVSHFCFGEAIKFRLASLMATHPPLELRIRTINPGFVGRTITADGNTAGITGSHILSSGMPANATGFAGSVDASISTSASKVVESIGVITETQYACAAALHSAIPPAIQDVLKTPSGARQLVYALLLHATRKTNQEAAIQLVQSNETEQVTENLQLIANNVSEFGKHNRQILLNLAFPALKEMTIEERRNFLHTVEVVIKSDRQYTLFEFVLYTLLQEHLSVQADQDVRLKYFNYSDVINEINLLITLMIQISNINEEDMVKLHNQIMSTFGFGGRITWQREKFGLEKIRQAILKLAALSPLLKKSIIEACVDCILHDGKVKPAEAELLQLVAEMLDCPMPQLQTACT